MVVGAGIVGCAIAVHLADQGVRPVVVDPDRPAAGASASSFASLSAFGKDPAAWYELACAGMASWSRWAERLGGRVASPSGRAGCCWRWSRSSASAPTSARPCEPGRRLDRHQPGRHHVRERCKEPPMLVRDLMSSPVLTVAPGAHLKEVADLLVRHEISAVPVVERDQLVGIVSEADLVPLELGADPRAHLAPVGELPARHPSVAAEVMTREVVALPERADAAEAGRLMLERGIKSIPVVREGRVVGIVARRDLLKALARGDQDIAADLRALLEEELGPPSPFRVTVRDGVVELSGPPDPTARRLATLLVRGVPGVVDLRFTEE
ncbi:MAG TPA: FAD-dependent oxidoreductase [Actinomycetota bacterium]|nr:FAD-dependent oxidoreductase [Actinomycetota bacterium]